MAMKQVLVKTGDRVNLGDGSFVVSSVGRGAIVLTPLPGTRLIKGPRHKGTGRKKDER